LGYENEKITKLRLKSWSNWNY